MARQYAALQYLREVRALLPDTGKQKREILNGIGTTVEEFLEENPGAAYEEIVSRLGSPKQIAASWLEEMDPADVMKKLHTKKRIITIVAAAAVAVVVLWAGVVISALEEHYLQIDGQFTEEIIDVTYGADNGGGK